MLASDPSPRAALARALRRKIETGGGGVTEPRVVAAGEGWRVADVLCTAGPGDRPYEERQPFASVSIVLTGAFTYRAERGRSLLSAGSLLLIDAERPFECSHEHGEGDRCLSFQFEQAVLEEIVRDVGGVGLGFEHDRIPPLRALTPLVSSAERAIDEPAAVEEIAFEVAAAALQLAGVVGRSGVPSATRGANRILPALQRLEAQSTEPLSLRELARTVEMSPYHFLRTFKAVTGVTPHQWLLRARLRDAARRLVTSDDAVTEVALDVGFDDLSNFIRTFRTEFGVSPRRYRALHPRGAVAIAARPGRGRGRRNH